MPADGQQGVATWQPWGPGLQSIEDTSAGTGWLGVDYTTGCDTRWPGRVTLGPLLTTLDLSTYDGANATANANGLALANGMNATKFMYVIRGVPVAKIKASDMSLVDPGTVIALGEAGTSIQYTKNAAGTEEISIGMAATAYQVITAVANAGSADTHSANTSSKKIRIFGKGSPADTYAGLGQDGSSHENTIYHNVLSGTTTMASPNWVTRATLTDSIQFTGFGMSGNAWVPGTNDGPYVLDNDFQRFKPLIPELDLNTNHCAQMDTWKLLNGLIIPLNNGLLLMRNEAQTSSFIGVEKYPFNTSPITGRVSALAGTPRWLYLNYYNPVTTDTYLLAARPRQAGDPFGQEVVYFPLAKMASTVSNFLSNIGTYGGRTLPTMVGGHGSDVMWFSEGRLDQFPDDTSYTYAASGSLYLTEMRREPHWLKEVDYVEFETANCFPSTTRVSVTAPVKAVTRRWFDGDLVEITTAFGHKLSGTPNHPVLTDRGWVALGLLNEGDHLLRDNRLDGAHGAGPNVEDMEPPIGEIFNALRDTGARVRRSGSIVDFHGDGQDGEVDVVYADGELWGDVVSRIRKPLSQFSLPNSNSRLKPLVSCSALEGAGLRDGRPFDSFRPLAHASKRGFAARGVRHVPSELAGITSRPNMNSHLPQMPGHSNGRALELPSNSDSGDSTLIESRHLSPVGVQWATAPSRYSGLMEDSEDRNFADTEGLADSTGALSSAIAFDDVVAVRRYPFSGHVYNLETGDHRFFANGIIAHNCTPTETITLKVGYDGATPAQVGAAVTSNGMQRFTLPTTGDAKGRRIKLQFDFARGGTTTATPQIVSTVRVGFHYRPMVVDGRTVEE